MEASFRRLGMQTELTSYTGLDSMVATKPAPNPQRARIATSVLFLVDGLTFGTWAALIPCFKQAFTLSAGQLSGVLFALVCGALVSMPVTGRLIARWGSSRTASLAAVLFSSMLLILAWVPAYTMLIAAAFLFGIWKGALDVSINAQSIAVENAVGRPIISGFQGFWSLGGLMAAGVLSILLHHGFSYSGLMTGMSLVLLVASGTTFGQLIPDARSSAKVAKPSAPTRAGGQNGRLWLLSGLAFLALFNEGVVFDWSAVYAQTIAQASVSAAPLAYAVFAFCMALGRFLGDRLTTKIGSRWTLRLSGLGTAAGIAIVILIHTWTAVLLGFALVGLGVANVVPILFGAAGRTSGQHAGTSVATVSTVGYFGFLAGPPVIGFVAAQVGLPMAFGLVVASGLAIAIVGLGHLHRPASVSPGLN